VGHEADEVRQAGPWQVRLGHARHALLARLRQHAGRLKEQDWSRVVGVVPQRLDAARRLERAGVACVCGGVAAGAEPLGAALLRVVVRAAALATVHGRGRAAVACA
jgi:hypothetical protein